MDLKNVEISAPASAPSAIEHTPSDFECDEDFESFSSPVGAADVSKRAAIVDVLKGSVANEHMNNDESEFGPFSDDMGAPDLGTSMTEQNKLEGECDKDFGFFSSPVAVSNVFRNAASVDAPKSIVADDYINNDGSEFGALRDQMRTPAAAPSADMHDKSEDECDKDFGCFSSLVAVSDGDYNANSVDVPKSSVADERIKNDGSKFRAFHDVMGAPAAAPSARVHANLEVDCNVDFGSFSSPVVVSNMVCNASSVDGLKGSVADEHFHNNESEFRAFRGEMGAPDPATSMIENKKSEVECDEDNGSFDGPVDVSDMVCNAASVDKPKGIVADEHVNNKDSEFGAFNGEMSAHAAVPSMSGPSKLEVERDEDFGSFSSPVAVANMVGNADGVDISQGSASYEHIQNNGSEFGAFGENMPLATAPSIWGTNTIDDECDEDFGSFSRPVDVSDMASKAASVRAPNGRVANERIHHDESEFGDEMRAPATASSARVHNRLEVEPVEDFGSISSQVAVSNMVGNAATVDVPKGSGPDEHTHNDQSEFGAFSDDMSAPDPATSTTGQNKSECNKDCGSFRSPVAVSDEFGNAASVDAPKSSVANEHINDDGSEFGAFSDQMGPPAVAQSARVHANLEVECDEDFGSFSSSLVVSNMVCNASSVGVPKGIVADEHVNNEESEFGAFSGEMDVTAPSSVVPNKLEVECEEDFGSFSSPVDASYMVSKAASVQVPKRSLADEHMQHDESEFGAFSGEMDAPDPATSTTEQNKLEVECEEDFGSFSSPVALSNMVGNPAGADVLQGPMPIVRSGDGDENEFGDFRDSSVGSVATNAGPYDIQHEGGSGSMGRHAGCEATSKSSQLSCVALLKGEELRESMVLGMAGLRKTIAIPGSMVTAPSSAVPTTLEQLMEETATLGSTTSVDAQACHSNSVSNFQRQICIDEDGDQSDTQNWEYPRRDWLATPLFGSTFLGTGLVDATIWQCAQAQNSPQSKSRIPNGEEEDVRLAHTWGSSPVDWLMLNALGVDAQQAENALLAHHANASTQLASPPPSSLNKTRSVEETASHSVSSTGNLGEWCKAVESSALGAGARLARKGLDQPSPAPHPFAMTRASTLPKMTEDNLHQESLTNPTGKSTGLDAIFNDMPDLSFMLADHLHIPSDP